MIAWHNTLGQKIHNSWKLVKMFPEIRSKWERLYPDCRKPLRMVWRDMHKLIWRYDCKAKWMLQDYFNEHLWRLDCHVEDCVLWSEWYRLKLWIDQGELVDTLESKELTWHYLNDRGYPVTNRLGVLELVHGEPQFRDRMGQLRPIDDLLAETGGVFVKPNDLMQGVGCAKILPAGLGRYRINGKEQGREGFVALLENPLHVEQLIVPHPRVSAFHPSSINTLRLITMVTPEGDIELNRSILRMGAGGRSVDNWCTGGLAVRIDRDGRLAREGWFEDGSRPSCTEHPDTHVVFEGYEIPFFQEAVALVRRIHQGCPEIFGIGWDVAITPDGPLIIESNVCFAIFQPICGGLRDVMEKRLRPLALEARERLNRKS